MLQAVRARHYLTAVVVAAAIAAAAVVKFSSSSVPTGTATVQILVDSPQSVVADLQQDPAALVVRAPVFAQLMTSNAVLGDIAHAAGIQAKQLTAEGPYSGGGQPLDVPTPSEARSAQILGTNALYHFTFVADATIPMVTVSVQGPSPAAAGKLASAVGPGVQAWLSALQTNVPAGHRVTIRTLGNAQAGTVNSSSATVLAGIATIAVLLLGLLGIWALERKTPDEPDFTEPDVTEPEPTTTIHLPHGVGATASHAGARGHVERGARPRSVAGEAELDAALERARQHRGALVGGDRSAEESARSNGAG
ncbi:MAG: hypothetical protein ACR2NR_12540 [Solirubrobacteraceae bacterium]